MARIRTELVDHFFPAVRYAGPERYGPMYVINTSVRKGRTRYVVTAYAPHDGAFGTREESALVGYFPSLGAAAQEAGRHYGGVLIGQRTGQIAVSHADEDPYADE